MRFQVLISVLVVLLLAQTTLSQRSRSSSSSSSTTVSSSSSTVASSSSSSNVTDNTTDTLYLGSDCEDEAANSDGDPCEAVDSDWCCFYTMSQVSDGPKYESWICTVNPDTYDDVDTDDDYDYSDVYGDDYQYEAYCANGILTKVSGAAAIALLSLLII
mmetsp:Transcript_3904/g.2887  ORF Transcript_3904/g.2887 Transcript_3904/m.2887 type:complete len:159 (+) Transcript_3904:34-510(+)